MAYSTPYDYNEDSIRQLDEKFSEIEHDRFLYCIHERAGKNVSINFCCFRIIA